jgi:RNA recognition motif-containing protein
MAQKLYVGNLPFSATEDAVRALFAQYGEVHSVKLISDPQTGRPRGFGFVEMEDGREAIEALDGQDFQGRNLRVNEAQDRGARGGGGPRGGGGDGGRGPRGGGRMGSW